MRHKAETLEEAAQEMFDLFLTKKEGEDLVAEKAQEKDALQAEKQMVTAMREVAVKQVQSMQAKSDDPTSEENLHSKAIQRCEDNIRELEERLDSIEAKLQAPDDIQEEAHLTQEMLRHKLKSFGICMETDDFRILMHELDPDFDE